MLTKNGVPWDVVMDMDPETRRGFCIAAGTVAGGTYDWSALMWKKPDA